MKIPRIVMNEIGLKHSSDQYETQYVNDKVNALPPAITGILSTEFE